MTTENIMACIAALRKESATHFGRAPGIIHLRSCSLSHVENPGPFTLICQHEELSLSRPNLSMPCIVVRKDRPVMPTDLLHDILAIILGFSGIHLGGECLWSAASIKQHFELEEWGSGMNEAFRRLISTTVGLQPEIESWVHNHFRIQASGSWTQPAEPEYPDYWRQ